MRQIGTNLATAANRTFGRHSHRRPTLDATADRTLIAQHLVAPAPDL